MVNNLKMRNVKGENMIDSISHWREMALEICEESIFGIKIVSIIFLCVIVVILVAGRFKPPQIALAVLIGVIALIAVVPMWLSQNKMIHSIKNDDPVICTVTHLGWERQGKRSYPVAYFQYEGKEKYAVNFDDKPGRKVSENDEICVWTNDKTYIMVKTSN